MPPEFPEMFVKGGWRLAEHLTGARTDLLLKWREIAGAERLDQLRKEYLRGDKTALERVSTSVAVNVEANPCPS